MKNKYYKNFWRERGIDLVSLLFIIVGICCFVAFSEQSDQKQAMEVQVKSNIEKIERREIARIDEDFQKEFKESIVEKPVLPNLVPVEEVKQEEVVEYNQEQKEQLIIPITDRPANDLYPQDKETVATISMPNIGLFQPITYGDSQENIDLYEVTLRFGHRFDQSSAVIMSGHNFKSFGKLFNVTIGNKIFIHAYYGDYVYTVDDVQSGTTDGWNIYNDQGQGIIDYYSSANRLHLYTCDNSIENGRLIVSAHLDE